MPTEMFATTEYTINGDPYTRRNLHGSGGGAGHTYDLEFNTDLDEVTLTEDSQDKTTLPLVATYVGTRADWNNLSAAEQAKYRHIIFNDESGSADISDELITFTNGDATTSSATAWTNVSVLSSPLSLKTLFSRISTMFKNIRYLYNAMTFSETETCIGTYKGSALYRKIIELSYTASSGTSHTFLSTNYGITASNIKRMYGYAEGDSSYNSFLTLPCYYNSNAYIQTYTDKSANTVHIVNGTQYNNNPLKVHLVVEYTK